MQSDDGDPLLFERTRFAIDEGRGAGVLRSRGGSEVFERETGNSGAGSLSSKFCMGAVGVWVVRAFCDVGMMAWFLVVVLEVIYYSGCRSFPLSAIFLVLLPRVAGWPLCVFIWAAWPCQRSSSVCASS